MGDDNLTFEIRQGKKNNTGAEEMLKMQLCVHAVNRKNGWYDRDRTFGDEIALMHSELSEALEAFRNNNGAHDVTSTDFNIGTIHIPKPEGVGSEFADVLVRLLDTCERYNIDLVTEFWRKVEYNATREYRHGNRAL